MTRGIIAVLLLAIAIRQSVSTDRQPRDIAQSAAQPQESIFKKFLPWFEAATSIATVAVLLLTYRALQDSSEQLALGRKQFTTAREAAQPNFQLTFFNERGRKCPDPDLCDVAKIVFSHQGDAEQADYSVHERVLFDAANAKNRYKVSPNLINWKSDDSPSTVWTRDHHDRLPTGMTDLDRPFYVMKVSYSDIFGVQHQREWILWYFGTHLVTLSPSLQRQCHLLTSIPSDESDRYIFMLIDNNDSAKNMLRYSHSVPDNVVYHCS